MEQLPDSVKQALEFFGLSLPISREQLAAKRSELLYTWYPARYANLTNNPKQYTQMYQLAEAMTRKTETTFRLLLEWLRAQSTNGSGRGCG